MNKFRAHFWIDWQMFLLYNLLSSTHDNQVSLGKAYAKSLSSSSICANYTSTNSSNLYANYKQVRHKN